MVFSRSIFFLSPPSSVELQVSSVFWSLFRQFFQADFPSIRTKSSKLISMVGQQTRSFLPSTISTSSESLGQIMGAREILNGDENNRPRRVPGPFADGSLGDPLDLTGGSPRMPSANGPETRQGSHS